MKRRYELTHYDIDEALIEYVKRREGIESEMTATLNVTEHDRMPGTKIYTATVSED